MLRGAIIAAIWLCATAGAAFAQLSPLPPQPADAPWPTQEWAEAPMPADVDRAAFDRIIAEAFAGPHERYGETRAVVIIQGGRLVYERYGDGFGRDTRLISWSVAKSFTHAFVGAAVLQGRVDINRPLGSPHWTANDPRAAITWRSFLTMTDGLAWNEIDADAIVENDSARMLFGNGRTDTARYAARQQVVHPVDTHWNYNSGGSVLLSDALTRLVVPDPADARDRRQRMRAWMDQSLFDVIGMRPVVQFDQQGLYYGSSQIYATGRDYARFGLLYLRDGVWNGTRILPEGWVDFARTPGPDAGSDVYGAHWWLTPPEGTGVPMRATIADPGLSDSFSAQGHEGQLIVVVPSKDMVVVRLGRFENDADEPWDALGDWTAALINTFGDR